MKVLFIARRFPPSVGGMERFAYDLANAIEEQVTLKKITWGGSNKWLPLVLPIFFLRASWSLMTERDIDVIHIQDAVQAPIGWLLHVIFRKPYVVVAHGLDITYQKAFYQQLILPFVRRASKVMSISSATSDEVLKRGIKPENASVITLGTHDDYNGAVIPNRAALSKGLKFNLSERLLLLTTGRLVKRKGVAWFISNVLPGLAEQHPKILYIVVGEGAQRQAIEDVIAKHKLSSHVLLTGRVSDDIRSLLYQSSDIFVMPNIIVPGDMEGFGIVVQEAAVAQLPVVASDLEGIKDALVDQKNGIMLPTRDADGFGEAIEKLITDKEYRRSFGEKAREFTLKEYSWTRIAKKYVSVYEQVTKKTS